jgi:hypothetical protein
MPALSPGVAGQEGEGSRDGTGGWGTSGALVYFIRFFFAALTSDSFLSGLF